LPGKEREREERREEVGKGPGFLQELELSQQVESLGLVSLEGSQAYTIEEGAYLFLGAALLHRQANDLLLPGSHAVDGRAQLSSGQSAGRAIRTREREDGRLLAPGHDAEKLTYQMAHLETEPLGGIAREWNSRPERQSIGERFR
jgi:hypothetical protein